MAKAQFHKNQRVYVKSVGTWAFIERVVPHWAKGLEEPLRVFYEVGLGREFAADELQADQQPTEEAQHGKEQWRVLRARNKWQPSEDCALHPIPGTYPIVITGQVEWGGWRVPGAEYSLDPLRIERQARLISSAPLFEAVARELVDWARKTGEDMPSVLADLALHAQDLLARVDQAET
jgi:hypothetical protein